MTLDEIFEDLKKLKNQKNQAFRMGQMKEITRLNRVFQLTSCKAIDEMLATKNTSFSKKDTSLYDKYKVLVDGNTHLKSFQDKPTVTETDLKSLKKLFNCGG